MSDKMIEQVSWLRILICRIFHKENIIETEYRFGYVLTCDKCQIERYFTDFYS